MNSGHIRFLTKAMSSTDTGCRVLLLFREAPRNSLPTNQMGTLRRAARILVLVKQGYMSFHVRLEGESIPT